MADRISLNMQVDKIVRFFERDVICASEAAHKLIDDIEHDMVAFGIEDQIEWLISRIPRLPESIQSEVKTFVQTSDSKMFVRNVHVSKPYPPPENRKPAPMAVRSSVEYAGLAPKITVFRDDGTTCTVDPLDPWPQLIFALRRHFDVLPNVSE